MTRIFATLAALVLVLGAPALAADVVPVSVVVPYGDWIGAALPYVGYALAAVAIWGVRMLPPQFSALAHIMQAESLITAGISYGINTTAGATRDKTLTLHVANPVLAAALEYVLTIAKPSVLAQLGEPAVIARMIWARLNLPAESAAPDFDAVVIAVQQRAA
jgi:hypothetical protein